MFKTINEVMKEGVALESPTLLQNRIDRLMPAVETLIEYHNVLQKDAQTLNACGDNYACPATIS